MKLIGRTNGKIIVASIARHDYVSEDGLMMDGGQPHSNHYAGYNRYSGEGYNVAFKIPQNFAELYEDYQFNFKNRKYGVWKLEEVKILTEEEWPKIGSLEEKSKVFCWGTSGPDGTEPLKYVLLKDCSVDHLKNILDNVRHVHEETREVIEFLIKKHDS